MIPQVITEVSFERDPTDEPIWTDISEWVKRTNPTRGRSNEFEPFEPGTTTLTLDNRDRRFDPAYASGPYYGSLLPMRRIRQYTNRQIGLEFWGDFEFGADGTADEWVTDGAIECKAGAEARQLSYVSSPTPRLGSRIARFEVASGDKFGASTGERALVRRGPASGNSTFPLQDTEGAVAFYQFSFRPLAPWTHPTDWEIFQEFKVDPRYQQPIMRLQTNVARTNFMLSLDTGNFPTAGDATAGTNASTNMDFTGPTFAADVWWDVRYAVKWTSTDGGFVIWDMKQSTDSSWTRYAEVFGIQTIPTTTGDATPGFDFQEFIGFYRNDQAITNVVFHDGYQVGHSWDDVSYDGYPTDSRWNAITWEGAPNILNTQGTQPDGSFESNTNGAANIGGGTTLSSDPTRSKFGSRSLKVVTDGSGSGQGVRHFKTGGTRFDVVEGNIYTFSQWYSSDTYTTVRTQIEWFDSGGASISTSGATNKTARTEFRRHYVTATAPAGAVTARLISRWGGTVAGTFWVDGVGFWEGDMNHSLFDGYVDNWAQTMPDRLFDIETTVPCSDGRTVLTMVAQPTSSPSVEDFPDVVNFYEPSYYYRLGEPYGTKVVSHVRKKKKKVLVGSKTYTITDKIRHKRTITKHEAEGVSGPSGTYKNLPILGVTDAAIKGDSDTSPFFASSDSQYVVVGGLDVGDFTGIHEFTLVCFVRFNTVGSVNFITGPQYTPVSEGILQLGYTGTNLFVAWIDSSAIVDSTTGPYTFTPLTWYMVAGTADLTAPSGAGTAVYAGTVGGTLTTVASSSSGISGALHAPSASPSIGFAADHHNLDAFLYGQLDEPFIIEKALTQVQLQGILDSASRGYDQEATGTRIENAIAATGIDIGTSLDAGQRDILPVRQFGQSTLDVIEEAVQAEGGRSGFFFNGAGHAVFHDRNYFDTNTDVQALFGDAEGVEEQGALTYENIAWELPVNLIANTVRVEAAGGETQEVYDLTSRGHYFERTYEATGVPMVSDTDALEEASWLLANRKDPLERCVSITFPILSVEDGVVQQALAREIGDRIHVTQTPQGGAHEKAQECVIEGISHDVDLAARSWQVTFRLSPAGEVQSSVPGILTLANLPNGLRTLADPLPVGAPPVSAPYVIPPVLTPP